MSNQQAMTTVVDRLRSIGEVSVSSGHAIGDEELMTAVEVATRLKVSQRFVRRLVAERRIEYVKDGRLVRFRASAVAEYIDRNRVVPMSRTQLRRYLGEVA